MNISSNKSESVMSGIRWSALGEYSTQGVLFIIYVILARLLEPSDFGLLAMAMVFLAFTDVLSRLGTSTIVIQQKHISEGLLSSLFFLNLAASMVIGLLLVLLSPVFAALVQHPQVTPILRVLSVAYIVAATGSVHHGLLRRKLWFNRLAIIDFSIAIIKGLTAVSLALAGWGVWALVASVAVESILRTLFQFIATAWVPKLRLDWAEIKRVKSFMAHITGFGIFNSFASRANNFIIGRFLGAASLGFYSLAFRLYTLPNQFISHVVGRVLLSSMSAVQDDNASLRQKYLRACAGVALFAFPLSVGLATVAKPFVLTLYSAKWSAAIPIVAILAPLGSVHSISVLSGNIFIAKGRTGLWLGWGVGASFFSILSAVLGLPWGLLGVTVAYALAVLILVYLSFVISFRLIGLKVTKVFTILKPFFLASAAMGLLVYGSRLLLEQASLSQGVILCLGIAVGFVSYTLFILLFQPAAVQDFLDMIPAKRFGLSHVHRVAVSMANVFKREERAAP